MALRGGVIFQTWHPEPPRPEPVDAPPVPFMPDAVVAEVQALLDDWALRRPPALQKGGLGVRELRRSAKTLGIGERRAQFLYALAAELGLLASERDRDPNDEPPAWTRGGGPGARRVSMGRSGSRGRRSLRGSRHVGPARARGAVGRSLPGLAPGPAVDRRRRGRPPHGRRRALRAGPAGPAGRRRDACRSPLGKRRGDQGRRVAAAVEPPVTLPLPRVRHPRRGAGRRGAHVPRDRDRRSAVARRARPDGRCGTRDGTPAAPPQLRCSTSPSPPASCRRTSG